MKSNISKAAVADIHKKMTINVILVRLLWRLYCVFSGICILIISSYTSFYILVNVLSLSGLKQNEYKVKRLKDSNCTFSCQYVCRHWFAKKFPTKFYRIFSKYNYNNLISVFCKIPDFKISSFAPISFCLLLENTFLQFAHNFSLPFIPQFN